MGRLIVVKYAKIKNKKIHRLQIMHKMHETWNMFVWVFPTYRLIFKFAQVKPLWEFVCMCDWVNETHLQENTFLFVGVCVRNFSQWKGSWYLYVTIVDIPILFFFLVKMFCSVWYRCRNIITIGRLNTYLNAFYTLYDICNG